MSTRKRKLPPTINMHLLKPEKLESLTEDYLRCVEINQAIYITENILKPEKNEPTADYLMNDFQAKTVEFKKNKANGFPTLKYDEKFIFWSYDKNYGNFDFSDYFNMKQELFQEQRIYEIILSEREDLEANTLDNKSSIILSIISWGIVDGEETFKLHFKNKTMRDFLRSKFYDIPPDLFYEDFYPFPGVENVMKGKEKETFRETVKKLEDLWKKDRLSDETKVIDCFPNNFGLKNILFDGYDPLQNCLTDFISSIVKEIVGTRKSLSNLIEEKPRFNQNVGDHVFGFL